MTRHRGRDLLFPVLAFALPLAVYLATLGRGITFTDSGELTAAAATLGIAHPPGYPLFTLLGYLFSMIPAGPVPFRVGLLSAVSMAGAAYMIYRAGDVLLQGRASVSRNAEDEALPGERDRAVPPAGDGAQAGDRAVSPAGDGAQAGDRLSSSYTRIGCLAGALFFAFARTPWSQAVVVEVYALQALLVSGFLWMAATVLSGSETFIQAARPSKSAIPSGAAATPRVAGRPAPDRISLWPLLFLFFSLSLANHLTGILLLPALAGTLILSRRRLAGGFPWGRAALAAFLPLLLYLYLPLRSLADPVVAWDYPTNLQRLAVHVSARQYQGILGSQGVRLEELQRFLLRQLPGEAWWGLTVLSLAGLIYLAFRGRRFLIAALLAATAYILYNLAYPIHDIEVYYIPVLVVLAISASVGAAALAGLAARARPVLGPILASAVVLSAAGPLAFNWPANDRSRFDLIHRFYHDIMASLPENSVLFTGRWDDLSSPAVFYQEVEGIRPDVLLLDLGLLSSPILDLRLQRRAPEMARACGPLLREAAGFGRLAEAGREYDLPRARRTYQEMRRCLVRSALDDGPVYVTSDLVSHDMLDGLTCIPEGLVFRVAREDRYRPVSLPEWLGPGRGPGSARSDQERSTIEEWGRMLANRAAYAHRHGGTEELRGLTQAARTIYP